MKRLIISISILLVASLALMPTFAAEREKKPIILGLLHQAAMAGDIDQVRLLISRGADVNVRDMFGRMPLHGAVIFGHRDVVELLLAKGADVNAKNKDGETPLYWAAAAGHKDVAEVLIARGASVSTLHLAALTGDLDKIRSFIRGAADVKAKDKNGRTPLHFAGSKDVAEFLIANGADVNAKATGGWTPLHQAAIFGHKDVVELLIAKGANINAAPKDGMTALQIAKVRGHAEVVELLLKHGAEGPLTGIESEGSGTPQTNYVAEINKIGIAGRPESDNAAPYYQKAIELHIKEPGALPQLRRKLWRPSELSAQEQALLRKWVQDNSRALEQLQLASQKPYCWFKHTGEKLQTDIDIMPRLKAIRPLAFALLARAMLQAEDGNITGTTNDIVTLYTFGAHVAAGPKSLIYKLMGMPLKSLSIRAAFNILDKKIVNADMMKSLEDEFKQVVTDYSEPFDIRGEKLFLQEQVETDPTYRDFKPYLKSTLEYYDMVAAKTPWQLHNEKTQSIAEDNPLIETAGSGIPRIIELEYRTRTDEQALITTLAILRYNADSDSYPRELQQLVSAGYIKELPIDPFSNNPLVYKQTREGFTLYSFGMDYDDDGGQHIKRGAGDEGGDQVFWPVERTQMAERPSGRERSVARTESPQRRPTSFARSTAQPYLIDDGAEDEFVPARPRPGLQKRTKTLHDAARDGDIDQVQLLISKGADVNEKNKIMGWTPLHMAIRNFQQALIEPLIANGADINATDNRGQTPLMAAIYIGQKDAVELLIAEGADVNIMGGRGDNALSIAKRRQQTEIVELLLKHGAKEPVPQNLMGDRYYEEGNSSPGYEEQGTIRRGIRAFRGTGTFGQSPVQVDILADPNGIKDRIKTLGLQKALEEVAGKSQNEMRQWQQKRYDNRTLLIRTVQKQFEDEIGFMRKVAVEEKAKKTTEAIDSTLSGRQERLKKVSKELLTQKREMRQTQPARGRGRARTSGRSTGARGRYSQRGQSYGGDTTESLYGRGSVTPGTSRYQSTRRPSEEVDIETENEINQWLQADVENKTNLAEAVHEQIWVEISSIRIIAVEEDAKKTTATIDGLLLYRQTRFEAFINKMAAEQQTLRQQTQDPRTRGRGRYLQGAQIQQQNQPRTRGRRR